MQFVSDTFDVAWAQSIGPRDEQQDSVLCLGGTGPLRSLLIISDGHGVLGDCSKRCVAGFAAKLIELLETEPDRAFEATAALAVEAIDREICARLTIEVEAVLKDWETDAVSREGLDLLGAEYFRDQLGSGGTLLAVAEWRDRLYVIHIGDSRAYHFTARNQSLRTLTQDHTWPMQPGSGVPDGEVVYNHDLAMSRALGHPRLKADGRLAATPDITALDDLEPDDCLVLCSDGLLILEKAPGLLGFLADGGSAPEIVDSLLEACVERATDNVTAIVLRRR